MSESLKQRIAAEQRKGFMVIPGINLLPPPSLADYSVPILIDTDKRQSKTKRGK